jgi:hypothetical protein
MIVPALGVVSSYQDIFRHFASAGALVVTLNSWPWAGLARADLQAADAVITITFEVGVQNLACRSPSFTVCSGPGFGRGRVCSTPWRMPATVSSCPWRAACWAAGEEAL